jgi:hypothetical protein
MEECKCKQCEGVLESLQSTQAPEEKKPISLYEQLVCLSDNLEKFTPQQVKNILNGLADEVDSIDDEVVTLKRRSMTHELELDQISRRLY